MSDSPLLEGRRRLLQAIAMLAVGGRTLLRSRDAGAAADALRRAEAEGVAWPQMSYRRLGRTNFEASRLVFGCGAALSQAPADPLLDAALAAGINVFDVGTRRYYENAERNLAPFLRKHRRDVFLISKAPIYLEIEPDQAITPAQGRQAAATWLECLDESLAQLGVEQVDAYYLMASNNPSVVGSDEIQRAFQRAKQAGKASYLGLSTHQNAPAVLERAIETGAYDLAMIAITPGGWYDWEKRRIVEGSPPLVSLQPLLARARESGIGLIGMKAGRYLAGRSFLGWGRPDAFDGFYDAKFLASKLSPFQRSYAFVLAHGLDCVNADSQTLAHLQENVAAAAGVSRYFA
jgi:aryl-alcohol dehydrogenase-like predicted oxidoreductase